MSIYQSVLAIKLSGLELAVVACIIILCIALAVVSVMLIKAKKSNNVKNEEVAAKQPPIVIYETKKVVVEKVVTVASEEVKEEKPAKKSKKVKEETKVEEQPASEIAVAEDTAVSEGEMAMRYNRSFRARLIQSDDEIKEWYGTIKNCILSHNKVASRISWKHESFSYKRNTVGKLIIKGKSLYLYLPLNAADYADSKYKLEDVSAVSQFAETPALYKIKNARRVKYAQELIDEICEKLGSKTIDRHPEDYYEPFQSDVALIAKGLVKRIIENADSSFIGASGFSKAQDEVTEFDEK